MSVKSRPTVAVLAAAAGASLGGALVPAPARAQASHAVPGADPTPGTLFITTERLALEDGGFTDAHRGVIYVPQNRASPDGGLFAVEFWRFPALDGADPATAPIFHLNGGPGWPGFGNELTNGGGFYEENIAPRARFADVIVVGQRGIGTSRPNTACAPPERPAEGYASTADWAAAQQAAGRRCRAYWEGQGVDLKGITVIEAAADVRDLAAALGYEKIQIQGGSFGSHWGMTVLRYHPEIVERAILNGMEGPDHTYDMPGWVLAALERVAADAEASGKLGDRVPPGGLMAGFRDVIARADADPLAVRIRRPGHRDSVTVKLDADDLRGLWSGWTPSGQRHRMATWPADMIRLYEGDLLGVAHVVYRRRTGDPSFPTAAYFMFDCGSGISPARLAQLQGDPGAEVVGDLGAWYQATCPAWDADLGDGFRENFDTEIPTVIIHGNWDTSTPLENALELVPHFKNSRFVLVERGTHGAIGEALRESERFRAALDAFIATGDMSGFPEVVTLPEVDWAEPPSR